MLPLSAPVPSVVEPSLKVTVPVDVPPGALTVAVKVTGWPYADGFSEEASAVLVLAWFTVCDSAPDVLVA